MSTRNRRIYKITVENKDIVFYSRGIGERGKDIAAVKYALGDIYQVPLDNNSPNDTSVGTQWFSCEGDTPLSVDSLIVFDKKLKTSLMNFQIKNQILILNYYWEKMDLAKSIKEERDLYRAIQFSMDAFGSDFGRISEATIAVLHGWRPGSTPSNRSFINAEQYPVEELPLYFYELITQGMVAMPPEGTIRGIIKRDPNNPESVVMLENFLNSSQESRKWSSRIDSPDSYFFEYVAFSVQGSVVDSTLYASTKQTLSDLDSMMMDDLTPAQRQDLIAKAIEPSHLTTKDPFEITNFKIGFFDKTQYTFQNLPEFGDVSLELRASLEETALEKILQFYDKKPLSQPDPKLINFIDFRAPSLRPGDVYRAYFEINKTILDNLPAKDSDQLTSSTVQIPSSVLELGEEIEKHKDLFCMGTDDLNEEQAKIQYEKYRSFAAKKKLEISRKIRQAALKSQEDQLDISGIEVDLGIFGKGTLTESEMANMITQGFSSLGTAIENQRSATAAEAGQGPEELVISFPDLKARCERVSKNFNLAAEDLNNFEVYDNIDYTFDAKEQARNISTLPSDIDMVIRYYKGNNSVLTAVLAIEEKLQEVLSREDTFVKIKFESTERGSSIKEIELKSPLFKPSDTYRKAFSERISHEKDGDDVSTQERQFGKLVGSLNKERTAHYLRNIKELSPSSAGDWSFSAPCDDPLSGDAGKGAAYILKYTKNVTQKKKPNEYNPYHNWVNQRKSDITEGFKKRLPKQDTGSPEHKFFKTTNPASAFGFENALPLIGEECTPEDVETYLKKQLNLKTLLCEYVACLGLPSAQIKTPNINAIQWPKLPTIELPGLNKDEYLKLLQSIANRAFCTLIKGIIDILSTPFCQDKFIEGIYGAASDVSPSVQRALADGFLSTNIPTEKTQSSKDLVDAIMNMLSPRELCALFDGEPVNEEVYQIIQSLSESFNLQAEFSTRESIRDFFVTIGVFLGPQICENLSRYDEDRETCSDVYGLLNQLRAAAQRGDDVSPEEIELAALHAQTELTNKAVALGYLGADGSLNDLLPDLTSLENNPIFSTPEPIMQEAAKVAARSALDLAKSSFVTSVNSYVSSFYINTPGIATVDDESYNSEANMKVQRAVANLQRFSNLDLNLSNLSELQTTLDLRRAILVLSDDYEKQVYNNGKTPPFEIYSIKQDYSNASGDALVSNSLVEKHDLTNESKPTSELQQLSRLSELTNVWAYMLPITAGDLDDRTRTMSTYQDWAKRIYLGQNLQSGDIITLNTSYINKINQILQKLQEDITSNTEAAFVSKTDSLFLKGIAEFYQISGETTRVGNDELLHVKSGTARNTTKLKHPVKELEENVYIEVSDSTIPDPNGTPEDSRVLVKSYVSVKDDFFLGTTGEEELRFSFCEEVPQHLRETQDSNNARVNAYSNIVKNILKSKYSEYSERNAADAMATNEGLTNAIAKPSFIHAYEGTLEQMAHNVRSSRIFEDQDYLDRLDLKIRNKFYFDPAKGCFRNPNNLLKYGALNFDQMVTELFSEQYLREFASPENSPLLEDYTTPGAFEKAMMNTSLVGFVRLCLVDMLLKGAITLSVWDIDFVKGNKFFREYMVEYVDRQIELQPFFTNNREYLDETLTRAAGTNNRSAALRKIVLNNADTIISDISKNLFENDTRTDFSTWFLDAMHLVSVPEEKTPEGKWKSNLLRDDVIQFRKNNFSFLENYIRIKGPLRDFNSSAAEIASAQYTKLRENFSNLQQIADFTNIDLPNIAEYDIANPDFIDINLFQDNDAFPNRELLSVDEFSEVIRSLLDNNSELSRYIHALTRKIHEPENLIVHGLPKTMADRMPAKAIVRTRTRYEFAGSNPFSALFKESPSISSGLPIPAKRADKFATKYITNKQKKDAYYFNVMTTGEDNPEFNLNAGSEQEMFSALKESFKITQTFDDRFYINPGQAELLLSDTAQLEAMEEDALSSAEVSYYRSKVEDDNKMGPHDGHIFRISTIPARTQDFVTRDRSDDSDNRDMIFLNEAGKVSKEKFDTFVESNPDLEVETWEETVIDLIADASPIFNQPGNSDWYPEDHMSDSDMEQIGSALNRQLFFTRDSHYGLENFDANLSERNALLKAHGGLFEQDPSRFIFKVLGQEGGEVTKAVPCESFREIDEAPWSAMSDNFSQTYASNDVEYDKSMTDNYFRVHKEQELLDVNEYKIPLRILITQVKDQSGKILKVFSKYILPEFLNFKDSSLDPQRASEMKAAILKTLRAFEKLNTEGFRKKMIDNFINNPDEYNTYSHIFSDPSSPSTSNISPQAGVYQVLAQRVGSLATPVVPIMRYPGTDSSNDYNLPANSSRNASWCSTSKFYSIACQEEANNSTGNFATSESHLDRQFLDPGRLMRRPSSQNYSFSQFKQLIERKVNSEITNEDLFNANVRHLFVNMKLQKHWLYDNSAGDLFSSISGLTQDIITQDAAKKTIQTIGNLVSWFNQRREDGFWGATNNSSGLKEASNFNVGPSLFYGDNRSNISSYISAAQTSVQGDRTRMSELLGRTSALIATQDISAGKSAPSLAMGYTTLIKEAHETGAQLALAAVIAGGDDLSLVVYGSPAPANLTKTELRNTGIWMYPEEIDFNGDNLTNTEAQAMAQVIEAEEMVDYRAHNVRNSLAHRQVATVLSGRYNAALEEIGLAQIIRDITTAYTSRLEGDETIISDILLDSEVSYGMRAVMNSTNTTSQHALNRTIRSMWGEDSEVSEEERIGDTKILNSEGQETEFFTLPIAEYEKVISEFDCFLATSPYMFKKKLQQQEAFMKKSLAQTSAFKDFYEFTIPYKNFASMLTVHSTSMLAGYGDMPKVLTSTKAALASVFEAMTVMDPYGEEDFGAIVSAADLSSTYGPLGPAGGSPPDCLEFPDLAQWFELIIEMLQQYIKYFPSVILRGIADGIDPMYKEMKHHYLDCQIPDLRNGSWSASSGEGKTPLGLRGSKEGEKMYAPIIPAFPVDIGKGVAKAWSGDFSLLATSIDKLVGYIYGGPLPLLDPSYAFKIPCLKINQESPNSWEEYKIGNSGRYGHSITPISLLALQTLELPGDRDLRRNLCPRIPNPVVCEDELE